MAVATGFTNSAVGTAAYTIKPVAAAPTFSPVPGTFASAQSVTISSATAGAKLYYTRDGTTPTTASTLYAGPIAVSTSTTLKVIATATGYTNSAVATAVYTIAPPAAAPTFSPPSGTYTAPQLVTLASATAGAQIFYTVDGSSPTTASTLYAGPIAVTANTTLNAVATATGYTSSAVATAAYTITPPAAAPTFSPPGGTYMAPQLVTLASATAGARGPDRE